MCLFVSSLLSCHRKVTVALPVYCFKLSRNRQVIYIITNFLENLSSNLGNDALEDLISKLPFIAESPEGKM